MDKVWIYQSLRAFEAAEAAEIQSLLDEFTKQWSSHGEPLDARGQLLHRRFVVFMVDERKTGASGCSIDTSVQFMQDLGARYNTDFFDRMQFAYWQGQEVKTAHRDEFARLYEQGDIDDGTLVFDNLVKDKAAFDTGWKVPLGESWHRNFVG